MSYKPPDVFGPAWGALTLIEHNADFTGNATAIAESLQDGTIWPLTTQKDLDAFIAKNPGTHIVLNLVSALDGSDHRAEDSEAADFEVFRVPGSANAYVPPHVAAMFRCLEKGYKKWQETHPGGPSQHITDGYHTAAYQTVLFANEYLNNGLEAALVSVPLPGRADSTSYNTCSIKVSTTDPYTNREDTDAAVWLRKNCVNYAFWMPSPDLRPGYLRFAFDSEVAADLMDEALVADAIRKIGRSALS